MWRLFFCWWWYCMCDFLLWALMIWYYVLPLFLWVYLISLGLSYPSCIFCRTGFMDRYYLNLILSGNILFSLFMVSESFAGYISLVWYLWSLSFCRTSSQDLLVFRVSTEMSRVILIGLSLYVTLRFSLAAFNISSSFCMSSVLIIMWQGDCFFFCPVYLMFCKLLILP